MKFRDRLGIDEAFQRRVTRLMQLTLVGLLFVGIERRNLGIVVNTLLGLAVTQLPAVIERDFDIPLDAGLSLWITTAAFLHALGTVGIPGTEGTFYRSTQWWDHMTHALSSSLVAAAGYTTVRALDEHSDEIHLPSRVTFVFILSFVMAFGVVWELVEFGIGIATAALGSGGFLIQFGVDDTMRDLVFNTAGGLVVAVWGQAYLSDVVGAVRNRLEGDDESAGGAT
ncbi:hypothetical protein [Haloarchaeobius iranensis]|uniref:Uncharacterized protein n=1 Tax=Haloarchaeobius iranensis TaxID=996166 RepID=A0A1G9VW90_9EURY|nr:hypothetical protein [Haloarchaeobius iranensis]SDM76538.1 hypothetical protein SAMN05192554_10738 [Haloarchaeobius iranensis]